MPARPGPAPHAGKARAAHTLPLPPPVVPIPDACDRGMHRRCSFGTSRIAQNELAARNRSTRFPDLGAACFERTPALSGTAASLT